MHHISEISLPCTQGKDPFSLVHPVTEFVTLGEGEGLTRELDHYLAQPGYYGLSNQQVYFAQSLDFELRKHAQGRPYDSAAITEQVADAALAGHLWSRACIIRDLVHQFTPWLWADTAVDWEQLALGWFDEITNPDLVAPAGAEAGLAFLRQHVSASLSCDYGEIFFPDRYARAKDVLYGLQKKRRVTQTCLTMDTEGYAYWFPVPSLCLGNLQKLYTWAEIVSERLERVGLTNPERLIEVTLVEPGGAWRLLRLAIDAEISGHRLTMHNGQRDSVIRPMGWGEVRRFLNVIETSLTEYGSLEETKIRAHAGPFAMALGLFLESSD